MNNKLFVVSTSIIIGNESKKVKLMRGDVVLIDAISPRFKKAKIIFEGSLYETDMDDDMIYEHFIYLDPENLEKFL